MLGISSSSLLVTAISSEFQASSLHSSLSLIQHTHYYTKKESIRTHSFASDKTTASASGSIDRSARHGAGARAGATERALSHDQQPPRRRAQQQLNGFFCPREESVQGGVPAGDAAAFRRRLVQEDQEAAGGVAAGELRAQQGLRRRQLREGEEGRGRHRQEGGPVAPCLLRRAPRHARPHVPDHQQPRYSTHHYSIIPLEFSEDLQSSEYPTNLF
jgi:hypothetical protein